MKKFNITVNGNAYEVEIEEVKAAAPVAAAAPKAAPAAAPAPTADYVAETNSQPVSTPTYEDMD